MKLKDLEFNENCESLILKYIQRKYMFEDYLLLKDNEDYFTNMEQLLDLENKAILSK